MGANTKRMIIESDNYCVYCHTNKINGKKYVGQTKNSIERRAGSNGAHYKGCTYFYAAIQKYGWNNFEHEIIASNLTLQEANNFEELLIKEWGLLSHEKGYNLAYGGDNKKPTEEVIEKMKGTIPPNAKKVICEGIVFNSINECARYYGVSGSSMCHWLLKATDMPKEFVEKNLHYLGDENTVYKQQEKQTGGRASGAKKVTCEGIEFSCIKDCAEYYNVKAKDVRLWLSSGRMPEEFIEKNLQYKGQQKKYKPSRRKTIKVYYDGIEYNSIKDLSRHINVSEKKIIEWLQEADKQPQEIRDKKLSYVDENNKSTRTKKETIKYERTTSRIPVICEGKIYKSIRACAEYYDVNEVQMGHWLRGSVKMPTMFVSYGLSYWSDNEKDGLYILL